MYTYPFYKSVNQNILSAYSYKIYQKIYILYWYKKNRKIVFTFDNLTSFRLVYIFAFPYISFLWIFLSGFSLYGFNSGFKKKGSEGKKVQLYWLCFIVLFFLSAQNIFQKQMLLRKNKTTAYSSRKFIEIEFSPSMYYTFLYKSWYGDVFFFWEWFWELFLEANMVFPFTKSNSCLLSNGFAPVFRKTIYYTIFDFFYACIYFI